MIDFFCENMTASNFCYGWFFLFVQVSSTHMMSYFSPIHEIQQGAFQFKLTADQAFELRKPAKINLQADKAC